MSLNSQLRTNVLAKGVTGFTGAAPQTVNGNTFSCVVNRLQAGTLSARVYAKATTNTLTITGKWQASADGSTWYDCFTSNNAAQVVIVTGTGSAVTSTRIVSAPEGVYGHAYARYVLTSGVGVGGGAGTDECNISYNYREEF